MRRTMVHMSSLVVFSRYEEIGKHKEKKQITRHTLRDRHDDADMFKLMLKKAHRAKQISVLMPSPWETSRTTRGELGQVASVKHG